MASHRLQVAVAVMSLLGGLIGVLVNMATWATTIDREPIPVIVMSPTWQVCPNVALVQGDTVVNTDAYGRAWLPRRWFGTRVELFDAERQHYLSGAHVVGPDRIIASCRGTEGE